MEMVVALIMVVNNEIKEARIQKDISTCLKGKRLAMRILNNTDNIYYQCIRTNAELEKNIDGTLSIKKLIIK